MVSKSELQKERPKEYPSVIPSIESMASQSKPASRWGSFLQQAVAGVESRLDTILAEEDTASASSTREKDRAEQSTKDTLPVLSGDGSRLSGGQAHQSVIHGVSIC